MIKRIEYLTSNITIKMCDIRPGENPLSPFCRELEASVILEEEACAMNADLVLITKEKRPNFWNTSYTYRASFYKY